jgi:pyridoxamine 5'-phosphate oxidase
MVTMNGLPLWRVKLDQAIEAHKGVRNAGYIQVATVRPDGRPAVRTVRFRMFLDPGSRLLFTTDMRSDKIDDLRAVPWCEVCWLFPGSREQFRVLGRVTVAAETDDRELADARLRSWRARSDRGRSFYTWPPPGQPLAGAEVFRQPIPAEPPPVFGVAVIAPEWVDYLDLRPEPSRRWRYELAAGRWTGREGNP